MAQIPNPSPDDRLMPGDAARMLGVTPKTLSNMPGLNPIILPSGHRRYIRREIDALAGAA